ncbi:hypothetical protein LMG33818_001348 [Halomonadaceae bacterium LMG 33818]|uniref:16S rRNA (uracil(1498)-N(3))-methyltransferase n=1 Tax=Cernens ardua TaxID=3402176 RepID=UPI003EDBCD80
MNLILFQPSDLLSETEGNSRVVIKDPRRLLHLQRVHNAQEGQIYRLGEMDGAIGEGKLLSLTDEQAIFSFEPNALPPTALNLHVLLALPRPRMLARSLQNLATLGVKQISLINTARVEKSYWQSAELDEEKIQTHLELGLEQARDTVLPQVELIKRFKPYVEDTLPEILQHRRGLVADPNGTLECPRGLPQNTPLVLAIGPEGGFIDYEVQALNAIGFESIHLGERILRVETAVVALISKLY